MKRTLILASAVMGALCAASYDYDDQGDSWTGVCSTGQTQSPVDITGATDGAQADYNACVSFADTDITTALKNSGTNLELSGEFSTLYISTKDGATAQTGTYKSTKVQFKVPAEHKVGNTAFDAEMQIIYTLDSNGSDNTDTNDNVAMVSYLFNSSADSQTLFGGSKGVSTDNICKKDADCGGQVANVCNVLSECAAGDNFDMNLSAHSLPIDTFVHYKGSETEPDCADANIFVHTTALPIPAAVLSKFTSYFADDLSFAGGYGNNRKIQTNSNSQYNVVCHTQPPTSNTSSSSSSSNSKSTGNGNSGLLLQCSYVLVALIAFFLL